MSCKTLTALLLGAGLIGAGGQWAMAAATTQPASAAPATQPDVAALKVRVDESGKNLALAEKQCDDRLSADPAFATLQQNQTDALKTLQSARESGSPDDRLAASSAYVRASAAVNAARQSARKSDPAVIAAKNQLDTDKQSLHAAQAQPAPLPTTLPTAAGLPGAETYETQTRKVVAAGIGGRGKSYPKNQADKAIADAATVDAKIQKLLDTGKVTKDIAKSMWAGTPTFAMNRDDLEAFGTLTLIQQGVDTQKFNFVPFAPAGNLTGVHPAGVHVIIGMMGGIFIGDFPR